MIVSSICTRQDEWYTPRYAVIPILKYINSNSRIWCPFDTAESEYVKVFTEYGYEVFNTHINFGVGGDFFNINPPTGCNYIISNPPYSKKYEVLKRLFELKIPFAMLVGAVGLFDSMDKAKLFKENDFSLLYLNPRVKFTDVTGRIQGTPPFQSVYVCSGDFLPKPIMFERLVKV